MLLYCLNKFGDDVYSQCLFEETTTCNSGGIEKKEIKNIIQKNFKPRVENFDIREEIKEKIKKFSLSKIEEIKEEEGKIDFKTLKFIISNTVDSIFLKVFSMLEFPKNILIQKMKILKRQFTDSEIEPSMKINQMIIEEDINKFLLIVDKKY